MAPEPQKTPAVGLWITRRVASGGKAERTIKDFRLKPLPASVENMVGSNTEEWVSACADGLDDATIGMLQNAKTETYVYGAIQYRDIFGDYHETGFCSVRHTGFKPFMSCDFGNWFDKRLK